MTKWFSLVLSAVVLAIGVWFTAQGLWIPAKAVVAQHLLDRAWRESRVRSKPVKPWPWADTQPIAKLNLPGQTFIVLDDGGGESLAFAPSHVSGSAKPGEPGTTVISAHRDTHFAGLGDIKTGQLLSLETASGKRFSYKVSRREILPTPTLRLPNDGQGDKLILVTCYPFGAIDTRTQRRFILVAERVANEYLPAP